MTQVDNPNAEGSFAIPTRRELDNNGKPYVGPERNGAWPAGAAPKQATNSAPMSKAGGGGSLLDPDVREVLVDALAGGGVPDALAKILLDRHGLKPAVEQRRRDDERRRAWARNEALRQVAGAPEAWPEWVDQAQLETDFGQELSRAWARSQAQEVVAQDRLRAASAVEDAQGWDDLAGDDDWDDGPVEPTLLLRADGRACAYEGQLGIIAGASESGKTRLADMVTLQELNAGRPVIRWDMENGRVLTRQALRDMGMTREQWTGGLLRYRYTDRVVSAQEAADRAEAFRAAGGRLVVLDSSTAIATALTLDTSGGKTADVQELYRTAARPWSDAGCCVLIIDNTNKGDPLELTGNQHKRSGVDFGLAVVLVAPHGIGQRGVADVYKIKDRASGIPFALAEGAGGRPLRHVGQLVSVPAPRDGQAHGHRGVRFTLEPPAAGAGDEAAAAARAMEEVITRDGVKTLRKVLPVWSEGGAGLPWRGVVAAVERELGRSMGKSSAEVKKWIQAGVTAGCIRVEQKAGPQKRATWHWSVADGA